MVSPGAGSRHVERPRPVASLVVALVMTVATMGGLAACSSSPEVPVGPDGEADPVLVLGRDVYSGRCSNCHGSEGQGGRGPRLNQGTMRAAYPDDADLAAVIANGLGSGMPAFGDSLSGEEIDAVVAYIREVLD